MAAVAPPTVQLACNPSSFAVYCAVRRTVLSRHMQQLSALLSQHDVSIDSDDDDSSATDSVAATLPKLPTVSVKHFTVYLGSRVAQ